MLDAPETILEQLALKKRSEDLARNKLAVYYCGAYFVDPGSTDALLIVK